MEPSQHSFAGIHKIHGGVRMRSSSLVQGAGVSEYIIESRQSSGSSTGPDCGTDNSSGQNISPDLTQSSCDRSNSSSENDFCHLMDNFASKKNTSYKDYQKLKCYCNDLRELSGNCSMEGYEPVCFNRGNNEECHDHNLHDHNVQPDHNGQSFVSGTDSGKASLIYPSDLSLPCSSPDYFDVSSAFSQARPRQIGNLLNSNVIKPVGFTPVLSSDTDTMSSPSDQCLFDEIEKSLDENRSSVTENIAIEVLAMEKDICKQKTSTSNTLNSNTARTNRDKCKSTGGDTNLEVSGILLNLEERTECQDLVGYGVMAAGKTSPESPDSAGVMSKHSNSSQTQVKKPLNDDCDDLDTGLTDSLMPVTTQPVMMAPPLYETCPPGLDTLLEAGQVVIHLGNFRHSAVIDPGCRKRMEVVNEMRRVLFYVEQGEPPFSEQSFEYHVYNRERQEVMSVVCPSSETCICRGISWHWFRRCHFQAVVYAPKGVIAGFVRRSHTKFIQEFQILNSLEEVLLVLRGAPSDLEIYSPDLENELGRLAVHGWIGIMHELKRTGQDYGLTFPLDLDVRVKAVLIGAVFAIHWLYSTKGGKTR